MGREIGGHKATPSRHGGRFVLVVVIARALSYPSRVPSVRMLEKSWIDSKAFYVFVRFPVYLNDDLCWRRQRSVLKYFRFLLIPRL